MWWYAACSMTEKCWTAQQSMASKHANYWHTNFHVA